MCYVLYMASDRDCQEIAWVDGQPGFYVKSDDPDIARVRGQFQKKKVYYLGSDQGCGCGFQRENDWMIDDPNERESKHENQRRLASYLTARLRDEESIELFGCWSGDEESELERTREITVSELLDDKFAFIEMERIVVKKEANQSLQPTAAGGRG